MSTVDETQIVADEASGSRRGFGFWLCRYLPAEVVGTAALVLAGVGVTSWTDAVVVIALAALVGECLGFYGVLAVTIRLERDRAEEPSRRGLAAEFGPAEIVDTIAVRPVALIVGVWLVGDPVVGLLIGKLAADVVFYTLALRGSARTARLGGAES